MLASSRLLISQLLGLALVVSAPAQDAAARPPVTEVLILGTYHFANPGLDVIKTEVADVLSEEKQAEILEVVEALSFFQPTKIAVERRPQRAQELERLYRKYLDGDHELTRNEVQQLGFRLAEAFEHPRVYPIDHGGEFPYPALMAYAQEKDPDFVAFVTAENESRGALMNRMQRELTIPEILREFNDPQGLAEGHQSYMRFNEVGAGDGFVGADLVAKWYIRNLHMFANLQKLAGPGERIILIVGAGHAPILRELVRSDLRMKLVDTVAYLPE